MSVGKRVLGVHVVSPIQVIPHASCLMGFMTVGYGREGRFLFFFLLLML